MTRMYHPTMGRAWNIRTLYIKGMRSIPQDAVNTLKAVGIYPTIQMHPNMVAQECMVVTQHQFARAYAALVHAGYGIN